MLSIDPALEGGLHASVSFDLGWRDFNLTDLQLLALVIILLVIVYLHVSKKLVTVISWLLKKHSNHITSIEKGDYSLDYSETLQCMLQLQLNGTEYNFKSYIQSCATDYFSKVDFQTLACIKVLRSYTRKCWMPQWLLLNQKEISLEHFPSGGVIILCVRHPVECLFFHCLVWIV